jgi:hypothetical protein
MFGALSFFDFYVCSTITSADKWGDVVFYYQTILFSQSAAVLYDLLTNRKPSFPSPHLQKLL